MKSPEHPNPILTSTYPIATLSAALALSFTSAEARPPNVLVILADALGYGAWKFIRASGDQAIKDMDSGAKAEDPRFALAITKNDLMFNLTEDPSESHDLSMQYPERLEAMRKQLRSIQASQK